MTRSWAGDDPAGMVLLVGSVPGFPELCRTAGAGTGRARRRTLAGFARILFALSFCPVSAGCSFAGLIPLTLKRVRASFFLRVYWCGHGLPVLVFRVSDRLFSTEYLAGHSLRLTQVEKWVRTRGRLLSCWRASTTA